MRYKSKYFKKYFAASVFIYIIPIIILLFMIMNSLTQFLKSEIQSNVNSQFEKIIGNFEGNLDIINAVAVDIAANKNLTVKPSKNKMYSNLLINRELQRYMGMSKFYSSILLYYRGDDYIYSNDEYEKKDVFFEKSLNFGETDKSEINRWLNETSVAEITPSLSVTKFKRQKTEVILYIVPIINGNTEMTAIFVIDTKWFKSQFADIYEKYSGGVCLIAPGNRVLATFCAEDEAPYLKERLNKKEKIGRGYTEFICGNGRSFLEFKVVLKKRQMFQNLYSVYGIIAVYIIGLLVIGMFLITWLTRRAYIPIMNLKRMIDAENTNENDDFDVISSGIEEIKNINGNLNKMLKKREKKLKSLIIKDILTLGKNNEVDDDTLFEEEDGSGNSILQRIVFIESRAGEAFPDVYMSAFEAFDEIMVYPLSSEYKNVSVFLIRYSEPLDLNIKKIFEKLILEIKLKKNKDVNIIAGKQVHNIYKIQESFVCADNAYYMHSGERIIMAEDARYRNQYPSVQLENFAKSLKAARIDEAKHWLEEIREYTLSSSLHLFMKKCIVFEVYNIFIKIIFCSNGDNENIGIIQKMIDDREGFEIQNFNETFKDFEDYLELVLSCVSKGENSKLVRECCDYIHRNFFEYDFSVQMIAQRFGISAAFLNQRFKSELSMNVYEYITYIKMENSKYMLLSTELPIKSIVEMVGYFDASSFTRKFKATYGYSPSEYRKNKGKNTK